MSVELLEEERASFQALRVRPVSNSPLHNPFFQEMEELECAESIQRSLDFVVADLP